MAYIKLTDSQTRTVEGWDDRAARELMHHLIKVQAGVEAVPPGTATVYTYDGRVLEVFI